MGGMISQHRRDFRVRLEYDSFSCFSSGRNRQFGRSAVVRLDCGATSCRVFLMEEYAPPANKSTVGVPKEFLQADYILVDVIGRLWETLAPPAVDRSLEYLLVDRVKSPIPSSAYGSGSSSVFICPFLLL
ncbi:hypothetical protein INT47_008776 [Mucor saturninus]|uniref:Uncharacterized protein n=1 Tax=Mucor saturninus TaxID=64648 RepID=A0A8H7RHR0_9FUNG|nr:hypothetical protein INT47_008776 [Mucor saturninus]